MEQTPQSSAQWLDFHEISILLAIEARQPDPTSAKSASEILTMRRAGDGWEEIARALGCTDVDEIVKLAGPRPSARGGVRPAALSKGGPRTRRRHVA